MSYPGRIALARLSGLVLLIPGVASSAEIKPEGFWSFVKGRGWWEGHYRDDAGR